MERNALASARFLRTLMAASHKLLRRQRKNFSVKLFRVLSVSSSSARGLEDSDQLIKVTDLSL